MPTPGSSHVKWRFTVPRLAEFSPVVHEAAEVEQVCFAHSVVSTLQVNLTELKTFPNPPEAVTNVMAAVMVLLAPRGRIPKERGWKAARVFMGKVKLLL